MRHLLIALSLTGALVACSATAPPRSLQINWIRTSADKYNYEVRVSGIESATLEQLSRDGKLGELLQVAVAEPKDLPAMDGRFSVDQAVLIFRPRFPLSPGVSYKAIARSCITCPEMMARLEVAGNASVKSTIVSGVYPSGNQVPENLLKLYVLFSHPMQRGSIYEHVKLKDGSGRDIDLPFLELPEELWDPAMTRLTLIIDPGRIKRGVKPLVDIGPVFENGKTYKLIIDEGMKDSAGNALKVAYEKAFKAGLADREPPDPSGWKVSNPRRGTRDPLEVEFNKPMDFAVAQRAIHVTRDNGQVVDGNAKLGLEERSWSFVPDQVWESDGYVLVIERTIEDLAGNNIGKPFDVDLFEGIDRKRITGSVKVAVKMR